MPAQAAAEPPTVARQVGDGIYAFDQAFGIPGLGVGANIPVRMTIMELEGGGYMVYNPCQPTAECLKQVEAMGIKDVRYIVLGTIAVEHKYYGPQWAAKFPQAEVWISPRTFTYPVDFGAYIPFVGFKPGQAVNKIPKDSTQAPWYTKGVDHLQLTVDYAPRTVFEETVMFHKRSGTFVCTDIIIGLSNEPPEILTKSPYKEGLLYFSRANPLDSVDVASPATLRDGYQRSTLLLNNINPRSLLSVAAGDLTVPDQVGLALKAPQPELGYFGWYPCNWQDVDSKCAKLEQRESSEPGSKSFECRPGWRGEWQRLANGVEGTGVQVPSFVAELQVSRDPEALAGFANEIARRWPGIKQAVPSHFAAPLPISAEKVRTAIAAAAKGPPGPPARTADLSAILNFRDSLEKGDLIYKPQSAAASGKPEIEGQPGHFLTRHASIWVRSDGLEVKGLGLLQPQTASRRLKGPALAPLGPRACLSSLATPLIMEPII
eukprot:CAMPEP_0195119892 /NCGR_PEP_ID=MMETSP0448-20130528/120562_1 /TAXON_ID=66468 /ORGANISM="Heterocapsa triquestra, Strain CCMP 448" /LENGTH=489 /DNA_ID=CAMNT_0040157273 /DNA_START=1 /DNA_END=1470 /DNA_ORIENTATION=+